MKIRLDKPPRMTAIDKKTGKEFPICEYKCGHLDKNKDGVRYILEGAHNGYPAVREPHEVDVMIEIPTEIRWYPDNDKTWRGYVGRSHVCTIIDVTLHNGKFGLTMFIPHYEYNFYFNTLEGAQEETQRLFNEWLGGLFQ